MGSSLHADTLVVGAGLAGLMAAHELNTRGQRVLLVDKGRSVGGRLATRRIGQGRADHGAQFFTARTPEFQAWVDRWLAGRLVFRWSTGWSDGSLDPIKADGHPRYAVRGGMNALAKHQATALTIRTGVQLVTVKMAQDGWQAVDEAGRLLHSRALLLTPPVPQSLALLDAGGAQLSKADRAALERVSYAPCLCGLFWLDQPPLLPEPGALQRPGEPIAWIADNQRKGISPQATLVTVHASPEASRAHWSVPEAAALSLLEEGLRPFLAKDSSILEAQLKRWRYALPTVLHGERFLIAQDLPSLAFAGDAFGGPRMEGAALSGLAAGRALARR